MHTNLNEVRDWTVNYGFLGTINGTLGSVLHTVATFYYEVQKATFRIEEGNRIVFTFPSPEVVSVRHTPLPPIKLPKEELM